MIEEFDVKVFHCENLIVGKNEVRALTKFKEFVSFVGEIAYDQKEIADKFQVLERISRDDDYEVMRLNKKGCTLVVSTNTGDFGFSFCSVGDTFSKKFGRLKASARLARKLKLKIPELRRKPVKMAGNTLFFFNKGDVHVTDLRQKIGDLERSMGYR